MKIARRLICLLCAALFCVAAVPALANSAAPPQVIVIVNNAPRDLSIEAEVKGARLPAHKQTQGWETYFKFYYLGKTDPSTLHVSTGGQTYSLPLGALPKTYDVVYTLDVGTRTLREGTPPWRTPALIALRVALTLLIEGAVFFLFGFRAKRSWLAFLIINLVTQGLLNYALALGSIGDGYRMLALIALEILVIIVEIPAFIIAVKERGVWRRVLYTLAANIASLIAGGYLITLLPV